MRGDFPARGRRGIVTNETPPSRLSKVHDGGGAVQPADGRLRGDVLPGRSPKHVCVFLVPGDVGARDIWFFGHEEERIGKNAAIAPGTPRDRGGARAESDGIDANRGAAGVRRSRASRLRRLFRAAIVGDPRLKSRVHHETHERHETGGAASAKPSSFAKATEDKTEGRSADATTAWSAANSRGYTEPGPCALCASWRLCPELAAKRRKRRKKREDLGDVGEGEDGATTKHAKGTKPERGLGLFVCLGVDSWLSPAGRFEQEGRGESKKSAVSSLSAPSAKSAVKKSGATTKCTKSTKRRAVGTRLRQAYGGQARKTRKPRKKPPQPLR